MVILRYLGYAVFFLFMFVLGLYYTFPWDTAKDRLLDLAAKSSGMAITAESLEPSWITGFTAKNVKVTPAGATEPITLERLSARAKVLAFLSGKRGVILELPIANGELDADVTAGEETIDLKARTQSIELGLVPGLTEAIGLPLTGSVDLDTDLVVGVKDPKLTTGNIGLKVKGLKVEKGGKMSGFPVPELSIGDVDWKIPVEAGKATFKSLKINGDSIEVAIDGTIQLLQPFARSTANLTVSFKPTEKFLASEPLLGALLNNIQRAKGSDGFYTYSVTGNIKGPRFLPKAKR